MEEKPDFEIVEPEKKSPPPSPSVSPTTDKNHLWFHPLAALIMIGLDFTGSLGDVSGFVFFIVMPFVVLGIFSITTLIVRWLQINLANDDPQIALKKGIVAGILCAIPMPIFGTAVGSYILLKSGLHSFFRSRLGNKE